MRNRPTLPNLLIIGAAKGGTTSLHDYLSAHPQIFMSKKKELSFFDGLRWHYGLDWYKANFDSSYPINGESSPRYTLYPSLPGVPERIRQTLADPKLIYVIRDPVDRILSSYTQAMDSWPHGGLFSVDNIENQRPESLQCSLYFAQLSQYFKFFPRETLQVVIMERLRQDPRSILRRLFRFLGVDEFFWSAKFCHRLNASEKKRFVAPWFARVAPTFVKNQLDTPTWMPWPVSKTIRRVSRVGGQPIAKPILTLEADRRLQELLKQDVAALRELLRDPLKEWRPYA